MYEQKLGIIPIDPVHLMSVRRLDLRCGMHSGRKVGASDSIAQNDRVIGE
jgi:hypothetical protein